MDRLSFVYLDFQWRDRNLSGFNKKYLNLCFKDWFLMVSQVSLEVLSQVKILKEFDARAHI